MIIGLINQKGGVGKTTLSVNIAHELTRRNAKVLLVDADPQQSALAWSEARESALPFDVVGFAKNSLARDLPSLAAKYDHTVIDSPPRVTELARACIIASDIVIIPCTPSPYDIWASEETVDLIKEAMIYKPTLFPLFAINLRIINTAMGHDVFSILESFQIPVLLNSVCRRIIFAESAASGQTVFDMEPEGKAAQEVLAMVNEIFMLYEKPEITTT